ncbi:MAG TPA: ABC transporter ATP-binding protein [Candidatus Acidoferrum sp.]|nr:ABC transporter ATP-binding protein [Candidatus Acidoferrum sp.]
MLKDTTLAERSERPASGALTSALKVERLSFRYARRREWALRDVSFEIAPGECVLISGPSGGGKTTLLRCLNGLVPHLYQGQYEGRASVFGSDVAGLAVAAIATWVGTVFQNPDGQMLTSTVESEVAFGVENLGVPADEGRARCEAALQFVGITHLRHRPVTTLSGGEKQRLAIAGTLVMRSSILLFDEPLSNIDPGGASEFLAHLSSLRQAGFTVVIVEQRVRQVRTLADRVIWLEDHTVASDERCSTTSAPRAWLRFAEAAGSHEREDGLAGEVKRRGPLRVAPSDVAVAFEGVTFRYPYGPEVLTDVSLALEAGSWACVIGRNGCGKTTLAKLTSGLLRPTGGRVTVGGLDTSSHSSRSLCGVVGYVFQNPLHALHASTVKEELAFYPKNLGWGKDEVELSVDAALAAVRLGGQAHESPFVLSGGEQQRVAIASVISGHPRVLILDEPTLGMTGPDLEALRLFIRTLTAQDRLVITITHDLELVRHSDRVVVLSDGCVCADGPPTRILSDEFVAGVFGA